MNHREPQPESIPLAPSPPSAEDSLPPRIFVREPGWQVQLKVGSEKMLCYMISPGQDYYHRILDGEVFLERADERLCLPCAARRGILIHEPRRLREGLMPLVEFRQGEAGSEYDLRSP